jgi:NADH-quinone oxidoreductase subunit C
MTDSILKLARGIEDRFADAGVRCTVALGEVTAEVPVDRLREVCTALRDEAPFQFDTLIDLCGIDYLHYGRDEAGEGEPWTGPRFAVVYHLLSVARNQRLRLRAFVADEAPIAPSVVDIWAVANWFEREAFDLFGILFDGHPDLRRLLTDYGFIGHPFRKDFPLWGNVEMRYDPEQQRVVYEPVVIEPRITVPRTIREDHRYLVAGNIEADTRG